MSHDEPRLQLHAYLKSLSGYRGAPLHVDLCFYVCNPKKYLKIHRRYAQEGYTHESGEAP